MRAALDAGRRHDQRHRRAARAGRARGGGRARGVRRVPDAHAGRAARPCSSDAALRRRRRRGAAPSCASARRRCEAPASRASASCVDPGLRLRQDAGAQPRAAARASASCCALGCAAAGRAVAQVDARRAHRPAGRASALAASLAAALLAVERGARIVRVHDVARDASTRSTVWQARMAAAMTQTTTNEIDHDKTIFRHRRHPRHGRRSRRSRRTSCCASATRPARCCKTARERAPDGADRQGHAHLRLHARSRRSRRASPPPASTCC